MRRALAAGLAALLAAGAAPAAAKGPFAAVAEGTRETWVASPVLGLLRVADGRAAEVDVGQAPMAVAAAGGEAWTLTFGGELVRVAGERVALRRSLRLGAADVAVGARSLWVVGSRGHEPSEAVLLRVDRRTLRVRGTFHLGRRGAPRLAAGHGRVWLAFDPVSTRTPMGLVAIEEGAGRLAMRRRLPGSPRALASGRRGVWVVSELRGEGRLREIAPDGAVRRSVPAPFQPGDMAIAGGRVWVTSLCGADDCEISRASVHAYDEETAKAVAGPFRPNCDQERAGAFLSGIAAAGDGVALATGSAEGSGLELVMLEAERGPVRCVPLSPGA